MSCPPRILEAETITSPMVVNPFRPVVLVPPCFAETLTPEEARMALAHELAHIRRRDLWLASVPVLAQVLLFFLPPAWLACREWSTTREAACDDEALEATGAAAADSSRLILEDPWPPTATTDVPSRTRRDRKLPHTQMEVDDDRRLARPRGAGLRAAAAACVILSLLFVVPWRVTAQSPAAKSILKNASFEAGSGAPADWKQGADIPGVEYRWDRGAAHTGKASLCLKKTTNRFPDRAVVADGAIRELGDKAEGSGMGEGGSRA